MVRRNSRNTKNSGTDSSKKGVEGCDNGWGWRSTNWGGTGRDVNQQQMTTLTAIWMTRLVTVRCATDKIPWWRHQMENIPRYWPFVRGINRLPVNSPHKGQWRGALVLSLICVWINGRVNNREAVDLRRYRVHYDVIVMPLVLLLTCIVNLIKGYMDNRHNTIKTACRMDLLHTRITNSIKRGTSDTPYWWIQHILCSSLYYY